MDKALSAPAGAARASIAPRDPPRAQRRLVASTSRRSGAPSAGHLRPIAGGGSRPARFPRRWAAPARGSRGAVRFAGGDFGEARRRRMLERTLEECEVDECKLEFAFDA